MKKCTSCGKEVKDDFEGVCPECGGEIVAEEKTEDTPAKAAGKKKLGIIVAAVAIVICVATAGAFLAINNGNNNAPVSQEESTDKNKDADKEETDKPDSQDASNADDSVDFPDETASSDETNTESSSSEPGNSTLLPEDFGMEDIEELIDEFNNTTDEERKEQLRLILEEIFKYAEGFTVE